LVTIDPQGPQLVPCFFSICFEPLSYNFAAFVCVCLKKAKVSLSLFMPGMSAMSAMSSMSVMAGLCPFSID